MLYLLLSMLKNSGIYGQQQQPYSIPDGSAGLHVHHRKTHDEEADTLDSGFVKCLVITGGC